MKEGVVLDAESAFFEQHDCERVAHRERGGGARGRREVERAGLAFDAAVEHAVGVLGQRRAEVAGHRDHAGSYLLDDREQASDLFGLAAVRDDYDDVVAGHHAEISVDGLGGMHDERRRAGAGERGRNLPPDYSGLAHAGDYDPPFAAEDHIDGALEAFAYPVAQLENGFGLDAQNFPCPIGN